MNIKCVILALEKDDSLEIQMSSIEKGLSIHIASNGYIELHNDEGDTGYKLQKTGLRYGSFRIAHRALV